MGTGLSAYTESILNLTGRLRTLRRVFPVTDGLGQALFSVNGDTVRFAVTYDSAPHTLVCPLRGEELPCRGRVGDIVNIKTRNNPHIAPCEYFQRELLIYDAAGTPVRTDIVLCRVPEGVPLMQFLRSNLYKSDRKPLRALLSSIAAMSRSLSADGIVHGNLKPENILVHDTGTATAADYALCGVPQERNDIFALTLTAMNVWLLGSNPELFASMGAREMFTRRGVERNLRFITAQAEFSGTGTLRRAAEIIDALISGGVMAREDADGVIENIAAAPFADLSLLENMTAVVRDGVCPKITPSRTVCRSVPTPAEDVTLRIDFSRCDFVGEMSDTLIRFRRDGTWGYADRHGRRTGGSYSFADDFYEGRAKVGTGSGYGLIDREGGYVMEPVYEALEWHGPANVATACREGAWELYDRTGRALTDGRYDWMGDPYEGTLVARRGHKYGYLNVVGKALTDFRFDEAYSPDNGKALVTIDGKDTTIELAPLK